MKSAKVEVIQISDNLYKLNVDDFVNIIAFTGPKGVLLVDTGFEETASEVQDKCIIGFLDQSAPQTTDNKQRFWSFDKPKINKNTTKYRANTFGFHPINGKEVVEFIRLRHSSQGLCSYNSQMKRSTAKYVCAFLRIIREKNSKKHILLIIDNARAHIAQRTMSFAKSLGITLVFLPTYSPDLNPIEQIWKSIRRKISQIFVKSEWSFKETIRATFHHLAKKPSFTRGWLNKFQPVLSNLL